jgi:hypothetical protein
MTRSRIVAEDSAVWDITVALDPDPDSEEEL